MLTSLLQFAATRVVPISIFFSGFVHGATNVTVDNQNAQIVYSPTGWTLQPNPQIGAAINGTVTLSKTAGAWLTLDFEGQSSLGMSSLLR